ncbi:MAG: hypothetical protein NW215_10780 [Hyphomicrobiales bacterium]|nr:hypothetical protein [Hyphomicrobiales bacterium]
MTPWPDLDGRLSASVDAAFAETFRFIPRARANANARTAADTSRAERDVRGVFHDKARTFKKTSGLSMTPSYRDEAEATTSTPHISLAASEFLPDELPRRGDRFERLARGWTYEANDIHTEAGERLVIQVVQL